MTDHYAECECGHGRHTHVRYTGACGLCDCPDVRTNRSEEQRAETLEANRAAWIGDAFELVQKAEAERDALRTAVQEALRALPENRPGGDVGASVHKAADILSRAIDTKEKP